MFGMHMQKKTKNYFTFYLWMYWIYCGWKWKGVYIYIEVFCALWEYAWVGNFFYPMCVYVVSNELTHTEH